MMSARKLPRCEYESPNIVIVPTLSFCKGPSTKDKKPTVEETKTVNAKEKVETFQIPCVIQNNNACGSVLNQDLDPVTSVSATSNWHVDYVQNASQFQNNSFEWDNDIKQNTLCTATNNSTWNTQLLTNTCTEQTRDGVVDQRFTCTVYNKVQSMDNPPYSVQLTQTPSRQSEATKDKQLPSESEKNGLQTKSLEFPVATNGKEIKMRTGITEQIEFKNKTKSINQNYTKISLSETTNDSTEQSKTSKTKQKGISTTKVHHTCNKKPTQQNLQSDHRTKQMKSKKNEKHHSISKTIDKREKLKKIQSKSTSSDQIKYLSLELKKVENEIQKRKRELMMKEMLIQKEQQVINQTKKHEQTDEDDTVRANNLAKLKSSKGTIIKSYKNDLSKKSKLRKDIHKADSNDNLISKIQSIKNKYEILKSKASKQIITSKHPEKNLLHVKSVVNVPQKFSLHDTVTLQNQYKYNKEKYTILQNYLTQPLTRTIQQSKIGSQSQEEKIKTKCKIKYRKNVFEGNHDNLHIMLNNENKETEKQFCDRRVKLQKKRKRENQNQPVDCKRFKKIELITNGVTEDLKLSTETKEKETTFEEESSPAVDLSFLDDINVDEIAEYLNITYNMIEHDVSENKKTLDQSVSLDRTTHITNKHDNHELTPNSLIVAQFESDATNSYNKFKDLSTDNNDVTNNIDAKILGEQNCDNNRTLDEKLLNVELLMEQMFHDNADKQQPVGRSVMHSDEKTNTAEKKICLFKEINQPSEELNNNECDKNDQVEKLGIHANETCETTCFRNAFNDTSKKMEAFVCKQGFNMNIGETENVYQKEIHQDHKTILSDNELISGIPTDKKKSNYMNIAGYDEKYRELQKQFTKTNEEEMNEPSVNHNLMAEKQIDLVTAQNKNYVNQNEISTKGIVRISHMVLKDTENKTDISNDVPKGYEVIVNRPRNNERKCFLNNNSSQPLIHTMYLNDNDTIRKEKINEKNNFEITTQTTESDCTTRENLKRYEDFQVKRNTQNETLLLGQVMTKSSYALKDRFITDHRQIVTQTVRNNTDTTIKTVDTILVTATDDLNDESITETVVETDNLFDITGKANDNIDVKIVEPILETEVKDDSDDKIVKTIIETVDLTKEVVFTIQLSGDDSSSSISSDSSKSTDTNDSLLDIHIGCKEIVDLNLIDSVENNNDHSNTSNHLDVPEIKSTKEIVDLNCIDSNSSNHLEEPEIKSTAGSQIKEQTNREHIDDQTNARHEIVLSTEQINAKCRNNTSPCKENSMKDEAEVDTVLVIAADNPNDAGVTENITDDLFDITGKANDNSDVTIVEPILETEENYKSGVNIVKPILERVDLTKENSFTIPVSSDDSTSISSDSSKSTDTDDSILDIHIRCKDIVDLNLMDSVKNDIYHSKTSNHLETTEIKSTASIKIKEQTILENIEDQAKTRHKIVLREQINAKCRNNTFPCEENATLENEAKVHVKRAVIDINIGEKNLPIQNKKKSEKIDEQSCPTKFKSINPTGKQTSDINDKPLVKSMTERIFEYIGIQYTVAGLIHNGKFSQIFKCKDRTGNEIAAKISKVDDVTTGYEAEQMLMKIQDGVPKEKFSCVHLITGLAVESKWCYLLEYYPKNLQQALNESRKSFHIDTLLHLAQQLVSAVVILRNNNIVHSDIKPSHILINSNNQQLKLCGFDATYYVAHMQLTGVAGTTSYRAPEAILGYSEGHSVDVWATALVLHEMATTQKLFPGSTNNEVLYQQMCILGKVPWYMVQRSVFGTTHFRGNSFLRRRPFEAISKFCPRRAKVSSTVSAAYYRDWYLLRNVAQREKDFTRLREFCNVLNQMLVLDPSRRLTIEFVYAHPLIYSQ